MNSAYKTKQLTDGAMMAVLTALFALLGTFIPLLNTLTVMVIASPTIFVIMRNNFSTGVLSSLVAAFLVTIIAGPLTGLFFYIQFMFLALAYGYLIKNQASVAKTLSIGTIISTGATILVILLVMMTSQISLEDQKIVFYDSMETMIDQFEEAGLFNDLERQGYSNEEIREMLNVMTKFITNVLPTMLVIASAVTAILNYVFARFLLKKFQYKLPSFPPFREWRIPWYYIWGFLAAWTILLMGDLIDNQWILVLGQNILIAYGAAFFVTGMAVMAYIFKNLQISPIARVFFVFAIFMLLRSIVVITAFIGLMDTLFDSRKKLSNRKDSVK